MTKKEPAFVSIQTRSILIFGAILVILLGQPLVVDAVGTNSQAVFLHSNIPQGDSLQLLVPPSTNISLIQVNRGQYSMTVENTPRAGILLFSPLSTNNSFSFLVNISSYQSSFVLARNQSGSAFSTGRNITFTGSILLNVTGVVTPQVNQNGGWNPLSGFTGLALGFFSLNLDATELLTIFAAISIFVIALGARFNQKLLFFGLLFLGITGWVEIGFLGIGFVMGSYFLAFFMVRFYFRHKTN